MRILDNLYEALDYLRNEQEDSPTRERAIVIIDLEKLVALVRYFAL